MAISLSRRHFLKGGAFALGAYVAANVLAKGETALAQTQSPQPTATGPAAGRAQVFFTQDLSAEGLRAIYAKVNQGIRGRIAVKLHTGEPKGPNILPRAWIEAFMPLVPNAAIVECNVLYPSPRQNTEGHRQTLLTNGWNFCPVDIMDAEGDVALPVRGGKWLTKLAVGKGIMNYDSMLVLTHFKGHTMGGFGGALKNIAIGCASGKVGKEQLHREGPELWSGGPNFMERMVEGGKAITDHFGPRITYINVLRNMSVDCDCAGTAAAPVTTPDIGILASTDILAVDQASVDMVYALPEVQRRALVDRIESRSGLRQLEYMKILRMGSNTYDIITL